MKICREGVAKDLHRSGSPARPRSIRWQYTDREAVYVILYLPEGAEPELFGPYSTFQHAVNMLRALASAAGHTLRAPPSGLMASIDLLIDGERHRYQLLKVGSTSQLEVHASVIEDLRGTTHLQVIDEDDFSPPGRFSSY